MRDLLNWILGGALCASALFHLGLAGSPPPPSAPVPLADAACFDRLELRPGQLEAIRDDCASGCADNAAINERIEQNRFALESALVAEPLDRDRIRTLALELGELRTEALRNCCEMILKVRGILDADQLELLPSCLARD